MTFDFENLDQQTRNLMEEELERDLDAGVLYASDRLTSEGVAEWPDQLRSAIRSGTEESLRDMLGVRGGPFIRAQEPNPKKPGYAKSVPYTAGATLAEGEFNVYYIRAICRRAIDDGVDIEIYRGRWSANPDPKSQAMIGSRVDPSALLNSLRTGERNAALLLPPHPNSGLTVRFIPESVEDAEIDSDTGVGNSNGVLEGMPN